MTETLQMCDYAYVIQNGATVIHGTGESMLDSVEIRSAYLGLLTIEQRTAEVHMRVPLLFVVIGLPFHGFSCVSSFSRAVSSAFSRSSIGQSMTAGSSWRNAPQGWESASPHDRRDRPRSPCRDFCSI